MERITGIYKITNKINGNAYIGQSVNIKKRLENHKCCNGNADFPLYKAIKEYGKDNFTYEILEQCTKEELNSRELYYIHKFDTVKKGYNPTDITDNPFYHKEIRIKALKNMKIAHQTKEHKEKQSVITKKLWQKESYRNKVITAINSKESKDKISKKAKEMWENKTTREKITQASKKRADTKEFRKEKSKMMKEAWENGKFNKADYKNCFSEHINKMETDSEYRNKMIQKLKDNRPNSVSIDMMNIETGEVINNFKKIMDAQTWIKENTKYTKADNTTISRASKGKAKTAYGYRWKIHQ